jgi:5-methylcytosine-specific restriction endonuclease McrA
VSIARPKGRAWRIRMYAAIVSRDGERCSECGAAASSIWRRNGSCSSSTYGEHPHTIVYPTTNLEIDHAQGLRDGGTNDLSNLRLLCIPCHKAKTIAERRNRSRVA